MTYGAGRIWIISTPLIQLETSHLLCGGDNTCICETSTLTEPVFSSEFFSSGQPDDLTSIPKSLKIGSFDPTVYDDGIYTLTTTWTDSQLTVQAWQHSLGAAEDIVIGVTDGLYCQRYQCKNWNRDVLLQERAEV